MASATDDAAAAERSEREGDVGISVDAKANAERAQASRVEETYNELQRASEQEDRNENLKRKKQGTRWRSILFWGVSILVVVAVVSSNVAGWTYLEMAGTDAHPAVLATWIGSTVVQAVALLVIITRHLFPGDHD